MYDYYFDPADAESTRNQQLIIALDIALMALSLQPKDLFEKNLKKAVAQARANQSDGEHAATANRLIDDAAQFIAQASDDNRIAAVAASKAKHHKISELRRYCADLNLTFKDAGRNTDNEKTYNVTLRATQRAAVVTLRGDVTLNQAYADMLEGTLIKR